MNTIDSLQIRTTVARGRLTELERRIEKGATPGPVVKPALKELSTAIEELQVASEHLSQHVTELAGVRHDAAAQQARHDEFIDMLPLACVWTDVQGTVQDANEATAALLNVAARRLVGKPLSLFVTDRPAFFDALGILDGDRSRVVDIAVQVRPRERRPRQMRITGHKLHHDKRLCWILRDDSPAAAELESPSPD